MRYIEHDIGSRYFVSANRPGNMVTELRNIGGRCVVSKGREVEVLGQVENDHVRIGFVPPHVDDGRNETQLQDSRCSQNRQQGPVAGLTAGKEEEQSTRLPFESR